MDIEFEEIYLKYHTSIYKYLLVLSGSPDIAEEITQETFYKAIRNIKQYNPKFKMLTWLCSIAKNTYFTQYKKNMKLISLEENDLVFEKEIIDTVIDSETNFNLMKKIHTLEEPYKEVFTLRFYGELTFKQISDIFSKSENWARVTYYRSKLKIKEELKNEI